jgi:hypothetical protein
MAAHALRKGVRSPGAMMAWLLKGNDRVLTQADEDAARRRLAPPRPVAPAPRPAPAPPALASPYGSERRNPGPSALAGLLARLVPGMGQENQSNSGKCP